MPGGHILFVCTGNTGRSVAAEALGRQWLASHGAARTVASRGVSVDPANLSPEPHVVTLLSARGLDVSAHRATALTAADIVAAEHILTMTARHREIVHMQFPTAGRRVRMLSEAASGSIEDVSDAFGGPLAVYEAMLMWLDTLVHAALSRLTG